MLCLGKKCEEKKLTLVQEMNDTKITLINDWDRFIHYCFYNRRMVIKHLAYIQS